MAGTSLSVLIQAHGQNLSLHGKPSKVKLKSYTGQSIPLLGSPWFHSPKFCMNTALNFLRVRLHAETKVTCMYMWMRKLNPSSLGLDLCAEKES